MNDTIYRQAAIDACLKGKAYGLPATNAACDCCAERIRVLPSAQSEVRSVEQTIKGYSIDQLILIANVLERENFPPERVAEALTDMQRVIAMVQGEFEESLRQSVKWFMEDDLK